MEIRNNYDFFYKNTCFSNKEDKTLFKSVIEEKIKKRKINIVSTFTFITPNHITLPLLYNLAKFSNNNCKIFCIFWDMNLINYKKLLNNDYEIARKEKINELRNVLMELGANPDNFEILTASDAWTKLVNLKKPNIYLTFFKLISEINDINLKENKIKFYLQYPADILFSVFFHLLFPEEEAKIDVLISGFNRQEIYDSTRKILLKEGILNSRFPIPIYIKNIPRISFKNIHPNWNMSEEEISSIVLEKNMSDSDIFDMIEIIFNIIENFKFNKKNYNKTEFKNILKNLNNKQEILSKLLFYFFNKIKTKRTKNKNDLIKKITDIESLKKISSILKDSYSLKIIKLSDGVLSLTEMAKKLKTNPSNLYKYIKKLQESNIITYDKNKKICCNVECLKINIKNLK